MSLRAMPDPTPPPAGPASLHSLFQNYQTIISHLNAAMHLIVESQMHLVEMNLIENYNNLQLIEMQNLLHQLNETTNSLQNIMQVTYNTTKPLCTLLNLPYNNACNLPYFIRDWKKMTLLNWRIFWMFI